MKHIISCWWQAQLREVETVTGNNSSCWLFWVCGSIETEAVTTKSMLQVGTRKNKDFLNIFTVWNIWVGEGPKFETSWIHSQISINTLFDRAISAKLFFSSCTVLPDIDISKYLSHFCSHGRSMMYNMQQKEKIFGISFWYSNTLCNHFVYHI